MGSITDWSKYPRISRIATAAAADVGRGSETLMTYVRGDLCLLYTSDAADEL